jgi:hypothetical protein
LLSLGAALLPGTVATSVLASLNAGGVTEPIGGAAIRTDAGDWSGGYIVVAFLIVAAGVWAFGTLAGWSLALPREPDGATGSGASAALGLGVARRLRPVAVRGHAWLYQTDAWLVVQPQFVALLAATVLAVLLTQLIH